MQEQLPRMSRDNSIESDPIDSLEKYDDNLIYKSNIQPYIISDGNECNVSLIVDKDTLVIKDYVYASRKSACGLRPLN